jgi:hypothetical protein
VERIFERGCGRGGGGEKTARTLCPHNKFWTAKTIPRPSLINIYKWESNVGKGGEGMTEKVDINMIDMSSLNVHLLLTPTHIQILIFTGGWMRLSFQCDIMCNNNHSFD